MARYKFFDRASILVNGSPYLENGLIFSVTIATTYNSKLVNGFSTDGKASGAVYGNQSSSLSWEEYITDESNYINWGTYLKNNPDTIVTIIPFNTTNSATRAHEYNFTGIVVTNDGSGFTSEGTEGSRSLSFACINLE
jgi:hypothetical protein